MVGNLTKKNVKCPGVSPEGGGGMGTLRFDSYIKKRYIFVFDLAVASLGLPLPLRRPP